MRTTSAFALALLSSAACLVRAQDATQPQLDPSATCPQQVIDQVITPCVAQVYSEEAARPGGACSSSDWSCICSLQSGLISCYDLCAGTEAADDIRFNRENCNGQHGVRNVQNGGSLGYTFGTLTTTLAGFTSTSVAAAATTSVSQPTLTAVNPTSSTPASSLTTSTSSTPAPSTSTTAAPSTSATNTGAATYAARLPSRSSLGITLSAAGLLMGALMVLAA
ncbi:hypothetical protein OC834_003879 [Tilletia horrida]|nr:hypothetical protein OC834_003879 [Tilletia horrida]